MAAIDFAATFGLRADRMAESAAVPGATCSRYANFTTGRLRSDQALLGLVISGDCGRRAVPHAEWALAPQTCVPRQEGPPSPRFFSAFAITSSRFVAALRPRPIVSPRW